MICALEDNFLWCFRFWFVVVGKKKDFALRAIIYKLLKAYSPANRTKSPQGFESEGVKNLISTSMTYDGNSGGLCHLLWREHAQVSNVGHHVHADDSAHGDHDRTWQISGGNTTQQDRSEMGLRKSEQACQRGRGSGGQGKLLTYP